MYKVHIFVVYNRKTVIKYTKIMNIQLFKSNIKAVLANNTQDMTFEIIYNGREVYTTKNAFGNRLLELFSDNKVIDVKLSIVQQKGFFGRHVKGFENTIKNGTKNIEIMTFNVVSRKELDRQFNFNQKMTATEKAIRGFGTNA